MKIIKSKLFEEYKEKLKEAYIEDWYFSGWEKLLLIFCFVYTTWSLLNWIWGML